MYSCAALGNNLLLRPKTLILASKAIYSPSENFVYLPSLHEVSVGYLASFPGPIQKFEKGQIFGWGLGMRLLGSYLMLVESS